MRKVLLATLVASLVTTFVLTACKQAPKDQVPQTNASYHVFGEDQEEGEACDLADDEMSDYSYDDLVKMAPDALLNLFKKAGLEIPENLKDIPQAKLAEIFKDQFDLNIQGITPNGAIGYFDLAKQAQQIFKELTDQPYTPRELREMTAEGFFSLFRNHGLEIPEELSNLSLEEISTHFKEYLEAETAENGTTIPAAYQALIEQAKRIYEELTRQVEP